MGTEYSATGARQGEEIAAGGHAAGVRNELYRVALGGSERMAGFYNQNMRVDTPDGPVVVRIPITGADRMDLTIWPEAELMRAIDWTVERVPRVLFGSDEPRYQVLDWIDGELLANVAPHGVRVPGHVVDDLGELFRQLGRVPLEWLPPLPLGWPADGDTAGFAYRLSNVTADVLATFTPEFGDLFTALGFPKDPLEPILERWSTLSPRPFRLLHTDLHRQNMIVKAGETYFLDWELALWGDPVYDLAVHLHKMAYEPDEERSARAAWHASVPAEASTQWTSDLAIYLGHERVKSAVVDTVRYTKLIAAGTETPAAEAALLDKLTKKVNAAHAVWGIGHVISRQDVELLIERR
ncbi:phosphotransferase [Frankia sp. CNm7]|uniref:Phosphotransferase n=1 Tax=Frankia nepalensis TaxID=1836974 RepID=A0A937UMW1_9ACTN|nr:phosphotransferase [Frankia nepalensis]MBL7501771.1 phosphotransferase [Frankia nepalensis]MBL7515172.1 phosphotransferase [Frankia nepalensis]MBL7524265.1 phosphotransferase [Frankia nepalensis]MBL7629249.1 phosphotransferase [Frankia nepalensis]